MNANTSTGFYAAMDEWTVATITCLYAGFLMNAGDHEVDEAKKTEIARTAVAIDRLVLLATNAGSPADWNAAGMRALAQTLEVAADEVDEMGGVRP